MSLNEMFGTEWIISDDYGEDYEITHILLPRFDRIYIKYIDKTGDTNVVKTKGLHFTETFVHNASESGQLQVIIPSTPDDNQLPFEYSQVLVNPHQLFYVNKKVLERVRIRLRHDADVSDWYHELDERVAYPRYVLWPQDETQELFEPETILYPAYSNPNNLSFTRAEIRTHLMRHICEIRMRELQRIIDFSNYEYEKDTAKLYFAYMYNQVLYMLQTANIENNNLWEEWLDGISVDDFFETFDVSTASSNSVVETKNKMFSHNRIYKYENNDFAIRHSNISGEPTETDGPELGVAGNHAKARDLFDIHPLSRHSETRLDSLKIFQKTPRQRAYLTPRFSADTTAYTVVVNAGVQLEYEISKKDDTQIVSFSGDLTLPETSNTLTWTVTSIDGSTRDYVVVVSAE